MFSLIGYKSFLELRYSVLVSVASQTLKRGLQIFFLPSQCKAEGSAPTCVISRPLKGLQVSGMGKEHLLCFQEGPQQQSTTPVLSIL